MQISRGIVLWVIFCCVIGSFACEGQAEALYKVLVVMSAHESYPWCQEVKEGIEFVLKGRAELQYLYLDAFQHPEGTENKARDAYKVYQSFQPDGVIAADDQAQSLFVAPFLKDKVTTPVMFCGVNAKPEAYGYPASNVSGILERLHFQEAFFFVQQLEPSAQTLTLISFNTPITEIVLQQLREEEETYPLKLLEPVLVDSTEEALAAVEHLKEQTDVLFIAPTFSKEDTAKLAQAFSKPTVTVVEKSVQYGILCAVSVRGQEHGTTAAEMLLEAMQGTPLSKLSIVFNRKGKRLLNVTVMQSLGIMPKPYILKGVEFVKTVE